MIKVLVLVIVSIVQAQHAIPKFSKGVAVANISSHYIHEASGICASRIHKDVLYTHNDSGGSHRIYAISVKTGDRLGTITIEGAVANDWEDIACGPCAGGSGHCIYIGDTGGNTGHGGANTIYRIREPTTTHSQHVQLDGTLKYSWSEHNCETVMVDNHGKVYIVSKVSGGNHAKVVHLPSSGWATSDRITVNQGEYIDLHTRSYAPTGGDISPDGTEVLLKTYYDVFYWYVPDRNYYSYMTSEPISVPSHSERQGEAVCFAADGNGYYTLSEGHNPTLYFYSRP